MSISYILSIVYLVVSFLIFKKNNIKISMISSIIYVTCLLFCYNILVVYICSFFNIGGSLFNYSLINIGIGTIINLISFRRKNIQKYYFDKKELISILFIVVVLFIICYFRFRGFTTISYESADSSVHYRHALLFKENLEMLDKNNSLDLVYGEFSGVMPISYVNCGFMMKVIDSVPTYWLYIFFDCFCLILSALLFFSTVLKIGDKRNCFYGLILSLVYALGFPLNNLLFGFGYLGLGVMVINLLVLTVSNIKRLDSNYYLNLILIFMICFSVFFSYYLFMPCIYLGLGIYYIYLWRMKKLKLRELFILGGITLIIPFIMGIIKFIIPGFMDGGVSVVTIAGIDGYVYDNKSSLYFFLTMSLVMIITCYIRRKKKDYYWFNFLVISIYVILFYILYKIDVVSLYYFCKLFYLYWLFVVIYIGKLLYRRKEFLYTIFVFTIVGMGIVFKGTKNLFSQFLVMNNIFSWNAYSFRDEKIILTKNDLELIKESVKYEDSCVIDNQFIISGKKVKNPWIYSITNNIPVYDWDNGVSSHLGNDNVRFDFWLDLEEYKCLIYFDDDKRQVDFKNYDNLEVLYSNDDGVILMKK